MNTVSTIDSPGDDPGADRIVFYADPISPYVYIACHRLAQLQAGRPALRIDVAPVLLAGLLGHFGQLGPAEIAPKRTFTFKDTVRRCHDLGLPLAGPATHPFNPLAALRAVLAAPAADRLRALTAIVDAGWGAGADLGDPAAIARALTGVGLDGLALVRAGEDPTVKQGLITATGEAAARGVFGVPTFGVRDDLVFGQDRLPDALRVLAGADPVDADGLAQLLARPAGATRSAAARARST
jgi:2-hydroxychromene-2-carboxylate isomerase